MANASDNTKPDEVGWLFVQQYYTMMNKTPGRLHLFYTKKSSFVHGVEGEPVTLAQGQQEIHDAISNLGLKDCKVLVSNVDSQASLEGAILIQVLGEISNEGQESRKFGQTFCLAPQESGYYVYNDIFRFLKEDVESESGDDHTRYEALANESKLQTNGTSEKDTLFSHNVDQSSSGPSPADRAPKAMETPDAVSHPAQVSEKSVDVEQAADKSAQAAEIDEEAPPAASQTPVATNEQPVLDAQKSEAVEAIAAPSAAKPAGQSKPAAPLSWAARAAANAAPKASVPATSKQPSATPTPAVAPVENERKVQPAGVDVARSAFLKNITSKMTDEAIRSALAKFGSFKNVELIRAKNCGFVDYHDATSCAAAIKHNRITLNGETFLVEERKRDFGGKVGPKDRKFDASKGDQAKRTNQKNPKAINSKSPNTAAAK